MSWDWLSFIWGAIASSTLCNFAYRLLEKALLLGTKAFSKWLDQFATALITGGRALLAKGDVEIAEGEEQDLTPGGFAVAGLNYGNGAIDSTLGASKIALGLTLKAVAAYLMYAVSD